MRPLLLLISCVAAASSLAACGTEGIQLSQDDPNYDGAVLFSERCSGCHTLAVAGTQGSGNNTLRNQGPNFDQRQVNYKDALFAIRNGGFSGAIMPQNIVVSDDAEAVAKFLDEYSGLEATPSLGPSESSSSNSDGGSTTSTGG